MEAHIWMPYLAFTLYLTLIITKSIYMKEEDNNTIYLRMFIVCFLWSIWYFYYLH